MNCTIMDAETGQGGQKLRLARDGPSEGLATQPRLRMESNQSLPNEDDANAKNIDQQNEEIRFK